MAGVAFQLKEVREKIAMACERCGRAVDSVRLVAVSKTFPAEVISEAVGCGQRAFGESRLQEAEPKIAAVGPSLDWHFIGRVQKNKVRRILPLFPVIHGIDSLKLAACCDGVAAELHLRPKVFLQVNLAEEDTKGGFSIGRIRSELPELLELPHLEILGLMCIPPMGEHPEDSRQWFTKLRELRDELTSVHHCALPCLSMGMSADFEIAIEEGATHVRVGSSIFGGRSYRVDGELGAQP